MAIRNACKSSRNAGFTLVELMIVVVIGSILLTIAIPAYTSQIRKSRRSEARTAVLDLAAREERFLSTANLYTDVPANLGYPASAAPMANVLIGSGYYNLSVTLQAALPGPPPVPAGYTITATATDTQLDDTSCGSISVDQKGQQTAKDSGGSTSATINSTCWGN